MEAKASGVNTGEFPPGTTAGVGSAGRSAGGSSVVGAWREGCGEPQ